VGILVLRSSGVEVLDESCSAVLLEEEEGPGRGGWLKDGLGLLPAVEEKVLGRGCLRASSFEKGGSEGDGGCFDDGLGLLPALVEKALGRGCLRCSLLSEVESFGWGG